MEGDGDEEFKLWLLHPVAARVKRSSKFCQTLHQFAQQTFTGPPAEVGSFQAAFCCRCMFVAQTKPFKEIFQFAKAFGNRTGAKACSEPTAEEGRLVSSSCNEQVPLSQSDEAIRARWF